MAYGRPRYSWAFRILVLIALWIAKRVRPRCVALAQKTMSMGLRQTGHKCRLYPVSGPGHTFTLPAAPEKLSLRLSATIKKRLAGIRGTRIGVMNLMIAPTQGSQPS
jgi:hypothetical protein